MQLVRQGLTDEQQTTLENFVHRAQDKARAILGDSAEKARLEEGARRLGKPTAGRTIARTLMEWHRTGDRTEEREEQE